MRDGKKPRGMKHRVREEKKREERVGLGVIVAVLIILVLASGFFVHSKLTSPSQDQEASSTSELKAAIVDHLSLTYPNQTFIQTATNTLEQAGNSVDYYPGEEVTVELYRNLPTHGYGLLVLRVHSTAIHVEGTEVPVTLFTSESYSPTKYVYEQLNERLARVAFTAEEAKKGITYFGIRPLFITQSMKGKFQNTIVIMMGCEGLNNTGMAEAFSEKGAKVYIGWKGSVLASHTDQATTHLLQHLVLEKQTVKQAVEATIREAGLDPIYNSQLTYYPIEAGEHTIQNIAGNLLTSDVEIQHKAPLTKRKPTTL